MYCYLLLNKKEYKFNKMIICIVLCLIIVSTSFLFSYNEAYAFFPLVIAGVTIAPEVVALGACLLTAAGLSFASSPDAQVATYQFLCEVPDNVRNNLSSLGNGIVNISDNVWSATTEWINSHFNVGTNAVQSDYHETIINTTQYPYSVDINKVFSIGNSFTTPVDITYNGQLIEAGSSVWLDKIPYSGVYYQQKLYVNGTPMPDYNVQEWATHWNAYIHQSAGYQFYVMRENGKYWLMESTISGNLQPVHYKVMEISAASDQCVYSDINVTGEQIVDQADYDYKTVEGQRTLSVPASIDDVVGKIYTDVQNPPAPVTEIVPYSNSWEGTFRQCAPTGTYTFEGTGTYTGTMNMSITGVWEGEWTNTATGAREWTGTYTGALSQTWTGTVTETLTGDIALEPDLTEPFKNYNIPDLFILLLKVILACIRLLLRSIVFLLSLPLIPADSWNINNNLKTGMDYLKSIIIPYIDLPVWDIVSSVWTFIISLTVIKKIKRMYSV